MPDRLAETLADQLGVAGDLGNIPDRALDEAEARLRDWISTPTAPKASPRPKSPSAASPPTELSQKTMESTRVPGLYAIGEAVDVTGWLGGYNFQWAWASAFAAGQAL